MYDYFCYMMPLIYTPDREYVHIFRENMEIDFPRLPLISQTEKKCHSFVLTLYLTSVKLRIASTYYHNKPV